ncbi:MAG: molybdopterin-dependent oxidoreductase [Burkholderiales bacterium]|nr:molybdopterin-dependent oxidoreductase [Burkholderiales bacterium]
MTRRSPTPRTRADFHAAQGVLVVVRDPPPPPPAARGQPPMVPGDPAEGVEILLAVWDDGSVTALNGHVDLGTGIRTALAQIAADELDVAIDAVTMVLGDTARAPNQGPTIASASIQIHAVPLRLAAAQARAWLVERAAARLGVPAADLDVNDGVVAVRGDPSRQASYADLVAGGHVELRLDPGTRVKAPAEHRLVGRPVARVDIPVKATGGDVYVHDVRVPGMLHGRVVRPPYVGLDAGEFVGNSLLSVDESSIAHLPGIVAVVTIRDFVGIVAEREEQADAAMRALVVRWKPAPGIAGLDDLEHAISANPSTRRVLAERGDVDAALAGCAVPMSRSYVWPYQLHASIGPSCAVADCRADRATVWTGSQNPHVLRADIALLLGWSEPAVEVIRLEASGCYGRNCADDVSADAVLLSRAVGRPVRVQLTREQEHAWEPKGAAQLMRVRGGLDADGNAAAYDFETSYPSNASPTLALLLTRTIEPRAVAFEMGDRTAIPPYEYPAMRAAAHDMAPILRASWLRGVSALPNSFAHESYVDELATAAGADPVEFRLAHLKDERAIELVKATAERAGWIPHTTPQGQGREGDLLKGQGFAYARYVHSRFPGFGAAWSAWVADVEVNRVTGEVHVSRVVVGHDAGMVINPAGLEHQVHGNVVQTTSRALKERVAVDAKGAPEPREWGAYPILSFREVPVIEVVSMPRPGEAPLGAGESSSVPGTAAIANAIFDATGVRFRQPPFTPEVVREALGVAPLRRPDAVALPRPKRRPIDAPKKRRRWWGVAGALAAGLAGMAGSMVGQRPIIAPVGPPDPALFTAAALERGRQVAAAGDCVVCHTAPGGVANAGGRAMETPFGTIVTTNLTPDPETGIGRWSYAAFERAMREGISRDGRHLYPAFPYTSFTKLSGDDLLALYAHLMSQPGVRNEVAESSLAFPYNLRSGVALWNALYLDPGPMAPEPARSDEWNRGAYLVEGAGHCGGCHTPRNALGAERQSDAYLAGAIVDGWEAPPLASLAHAPVPWTVDELERYLREGHTRHHGSVAGPMAPIVRELATLPASDVRAMAVYLASLGAPVSDEAADAAARAAVEASVATAATIRDPAQRLFEGACGACHHDGAGPVLLGRNLPLALHSSLHSSRPDNLIRVVLEGIAEPATRELGFMPSFRDAMSDRQIAELAAYMRARYAPAKPAWRDLEAEVARLRAFRPH